MNVKWKFRAAHLVLLALFIAVATGCKKKDDTSPAVTINDFTGTWIATSSIVTNNSNSDEQYDVIANGGEIRTTVLEGGKARTWYTLGSFSDEWDAQLKISGNLLVSTPAEEIRNPQTFEFELDGNNLTLTNHNSSFDFTMSGGNVVSATEVTVLIRD